MQSRFHRGSIVLLALAPLLLQCTHGTYKYSGQFHSSDGELRGSFDAVHIQPHYTNAAGCALTFFIYGGWCWSYLFEPTSRVTLSAYEATQSELSGKFGRPIELAPMPLVLLNWGQGINPHINYQLIQGRDQITQGKVASGEKIASQTTSAKPDKAAPGYGRIEADDSESPSATVQLQSGAKLIFPFILGFGLGYEYVSPFKTSVELGGGIVAGNHRGLFQQIKHPLIETRRNILKFGAAAAQLQTPRRAAKSSPSDKSHLYFHNEAAYGMVLELESKDMPSFQLLYFLDKIDYEITPFVLNFVYPLKD